jgi:lipoate---protein ligase
VSEERVIATFPEHARERWRAFDWQFVPMVPEAPAMNLALDEVLTQAIGRGARGPLLRFWGWTDQCVVIGRFQSVRNEVQEENAARLGVQIVRRISGGGAMFIEPDKAITWSIYVPPAFVEGLSFPDSYALLDSWVIEALQDLGVDAWYAPLNDITSAGGKVGGAAQARRFGGVLHHTTMAYDMNTGVMTQVLRIGQEKISDKGLRSAEKRVGPLRQQTRMDRIEIINHLTQRFITVTGATPGEITPTERLEALELVQSKFAAPSWTYLLP